MGTDFTVGDFSNQVPVLSSLGNFGKCFFLLQLLQKVHLTQAIKYLCIKVDGQEIKCIVIMSNVLEIEGSMPLLQARGTCSAYICVLLKMTAVYEDF